MNDKPNIVFIVLDSVRFDRTSVGGYNRNTTPNLDRIANMFRGNSFSTAVAHARYTLPSVASILSGRHPIEHRVGLDKTTLESSISTVPEAFRQAGYTTAGVSNNAFVSEETGLARGFDSFVLKPNSVSGIVKTVGIKPTLRWITNLQEHSAGFTTDAPRHSTAYLLSSLTKQRLKQLELQSEPFFLYTHFDQPHRPYSPPKSWVETYADRFAMSPSEAVDFSMDVHNNLEQYVAEGLQLTEDQWAVLNALYDAQIEYTDQFIGKLFDYIQCRCKDTIVVVTADHGEHMGERGALGHKYALDDALLNVPLVTWGIDPASTEHPVQHTDVMRTLLQIAGAESEFVDGIDLRNETRECAISQDTSRSLEALHKHSSQLDPTQFFPDIDRTLPARTSLRTGSYRYTRETHEPKRLSELIDVNTHNNIVQPEVEAELNLKLDQWLKERQSLGLSTQEAADTDRISAPAKERLRQMGYLEEDLK